MEKRRSNQSYQSERTGDQSSIDTQADVDTIRLRHEGTKHLPAGVNRRFLKFAGIFIGKEDKVSTALENAVAGPRSKLVNRMVPFLNSPLVRLQSNSASCSMRQEREHWIAT